MRTPKSLTPITALLALACVGNPDRRTLAELHDVEPDLAEVRVEDGLDQAMAAYQAFLEEAPESALTPEAMRRLADLKLEKEFGILGGDGPVTLPAPEAGAAPDAPRAATAPRVAATEGAASLETQEAFERRAAGAEFLPAPAPAEDLALPGGGSVDGSGPREAIALYDEILATYPDYQHNDQILYQKARAYDELGRNDEAIEVIEELITRFPGSLHVDEVQFRRGEYFFVRRDYLAAEGAYAAVVAMGAGSDYYELALYKLGWAFYKQQLHEEALDQYVALLDYKVSTGYDFDQTEDEGAERRIADAFRVVSLGFSELGGPEVVKQYFAASGTRSYEDRIYRQLGEFYLEKLRYHDAAASYQAFVDLHPLHRSAPHFSMRVVEIYEAGGFPKLVLDSKKTFAATYGLRAEYWRHFGVEDAPEVLSYLKANLEDLASHYHALYQGGGAEQERPENFGEARRWYGEYLASFPEDPETPAVHYRLADLHLEHEDFGDAARAYERTAYDYAAHEKSSAAGYAAIYAHREHQKRAGPEDLAAVRAQAVESSLRFAETFPDHEHAAVVMGAAVNDLYTMQDFARAIATARRLLEAHPDAAPEVVRGAWAVIAHASLDTADYVQAEDAYGRVLAMTPADDDSRQDVVDSLAAAIYKQGERANLAGDHRAAADHFLRIALAAPTSAIRPAAEYDAGAALIQLEDWSAATSVLDAFRENHPEHELHREATKQIARIYREQGEIGRAAGEYERAAAEAEEPEVRGEALLVAGGLYEDSQRDERALAVYRAYVDEFPAPLELAVETRSKIAEIHDRRGAQAERREELQRIVAFDRAAGAERSPRIRFLAAHAALALSEGLYDRFEEIELVQPFEEHLREKQRRMNEAMGAFGGLVDYEVGEVTAAATYYMAEVYSEFSRALMASERPADLDPAALQDYELVLEEEAYPFEERAIDVHQKNLELMAAGVFNPWIEKSLGRLAQLMPGRYAKFEASAGPIESLDRYAYRVPAARVPDVPEASPVPAAPELAPAQDAPPAAPAPGVDPDAAPPTGDLDAG